MFNFLLWYGLISWYFLFHIKIEKLPNLGKFKFFVKDMQRWHICSWETYEINMLSPGIIGTGALICCGMAMPGGGIAAPTGSWPGTACNTGASVCRPGTVVAGIVAPGFSWPNLDKPAKTHKSKDSILESVDEGQGLETICVKKLEKSS